MTTRATADFTDLPIDDAYSALSASANGLSENGAKKRISEYG